MRPAQLSSLTAIILIGIAALYVFKFAERTPDYEVYRRG